MLLCHGTAPASLLKYFVSSILLWSATSERLSLLPLKRRKPSVSLLSGSQPAASCSFLHWLAQRFHEDLHRLQYDH